MWRAEDHPGLNINNIKFEFYDSKSPAAGHDNYVQYANVVMARKRIGPLVATGGSTSIQGQLIKSGIKSYPNSANSILTVTGKPGWTGKARIAVFKLEGNKISETAHEVSFPHQVDVSSYAPGVYFVKVSSGSKYFTQKVIIN
jgi:hypothetical protein